MPFRVDNERREKHFLLADREESRSRTQGKVCTPTELFEVRGGDGLAGSASAVVKFLIEQLRFDQHPMDPCLFNLRERSSRGLPVTRRCVEVLLWRCLSVLGEVCVESWEFTLSIKSMEGEAYDGKMR